MVSVYKDFQAYTPEMNSGQCTPESERFFNVSQKYLNLGDTALRPSNLISIGDTLTESTMPEYRYYGAWAYLEAAYPGMFGTTEKLAASAQNVDTKGLSDEAFRIFKGLADRTPYNVEIVSQGMRYADIVFGLKSLISSSMRESFTACAPREQTAQRVAQAYTVGAVLFRKQDQTLAELRRQTPSPEQKVDYGYIESVVRGLEVENMLLGMSWTHQANSSSAQKTRSVLVPSSPRHDVFGRADIIAIHQDTEERRSIPLKRDVVQSRKKQGNPLIEPGKNIYLYGDRDLGLSSLSRVLHYHPKDFTHFDPKLSERIALLIDRQFER